MNEVKMIIDIDNIWDPTINTEKFTDCHKLRYDLDWIQSLITYVTNLETKYKKMQHHKLLSKAEDQRMQDFFDDLEEYIFEFYYWSSKKHCNQYFNKNGYPDTFKYYDNEN